MFLKETAEFTKEFIKELLKYACLWQLSKVLDDTLKYDAHGVKTNSIIAIKLNPACWRLAGSHERFIAWGIELP